MRDRLFLLSALLGLGALLMTAVLWLIGPRQMGPLPAGFVTPVMAFEFAATPAEVGHLFSVDGAATAMDRVNRWDFLYMALYNGFLSAFALACVRQTGNRYYYAVAALPLLILFADAMENVQLLDITALLAGESVEPVLGQMQTLLDRLRLFTWLKWGGLALYFVLLWPYFRGRPGWARWIGYVGVLPALLAVVALFSRGLANELMALAIGVMFLLLTVYAWRAAAADAKPRLAHQTG
jgi:hypothetical protein